MQRFTLDGSRAGEEEVVSTGLSHFDRDANDVVTYSRDGGVVAEEVVSLGGGNHLVSFSRQNPDGNLTSQGGAPEDPGGR